MSFCPNCHNLLNITDNVVATLEKQTKVSKGGKKKEDIEKEGNQIKQTKKEEKRENKISDIITRILEKEEVSQDELDEITLDDLRKNSTFQKLKDDEREKILTKYTGLSKKKKSALTGTGAYFVCEICGYFTGIEAGSLIYTKNYGVSDYTEFIDYAELVNDPTLPRIRFICQNDLCSSKNSEDSLAEIVIFRDDNYHIFYICSECKTFWNVSDKAN